jgi:hypothetical protein
MRSTATYAPTRLIMYMCVNFASTPLSTALPQMTVVHIAVLLNRCVVHTQVHTQALNRVPMCTLHYPRYVSARDRAQSQSDTICHSSVSVSEQQLLLKRDCTDNTVTERLLLACTTSTDER